MSSLMNVKSVCPTGEEPSGQVRIQTGTLVRLSENHRQPDGNTQFRAKDVYAKSVPVSHEKLYVSSVTKLSKNTLNRCAVVLRQLSVIITVGTSNPEGISDTLNRNCT